MSISHSWILPSAPGEGARLRGISHTYQRTLAYSLALLLPFVSLLKLTNHAVDDNPFLLALAPVMISGWYGGLLPSLVSAAISILISAYYFAVPIGSFRVAEPLPFALFVLEIFTICLLTEALHRGRRRSEGLLSELTTKTRALETSELQLRQANDQLRHRAFQEIAEHSAGRQRAEEALRSSEEQLRQAQKMEAVGRLAGGIAHDFNNVMTVILSYCSLTMDGLKPGDPLLEDMEEIQKAGKRAAELTAQLLAFSRQQVLQPQVVEMNEVVAGMGKMIGRLVGEDVTVTTSLASAAGRAYCDPGQIGQVIMNLVVNARDAMPTGGRLTIETANIDLDETYASEHVGAAVGPHVMLAVSDTGVGMDAATRAQIFEPFFTTKGIGKGTGLGLSMAYGIVKQSGGSIWVYSEIGSGTTFKIYLPRIDTAATAPSLDEIPTERRGTETVLVVEDEPQLRKLASRVLTARGFQVLEAKDGQEALRFFQEPSQTIDLVLTDVVMPTMGGRELSERLAKIRPDLRVIFMSGYTDDVVVRHGVLAEGVAYLQKPVTPSQLLARVRAEIDRSTEIGRLAF